MAQTFDRDRWILQQDARLLSECRVDTYRASGPGGQKRNKTSSAVRLRHNPSGLMAIGEESRSQHENKARALRRLRLAIALKVRRPISKDWTSPEVYLKYRTAAGRIEINPRNPDYAAVVAVVLDAVDGSRGVVKDAAALLGLGTAQLSKFMGKAGSVLAAANAIRDKAGLKPLTRPI